jgi:hypothetical protein
VSSLLEVDYPFSMQADRSTLRQVLLQSYVSARLADLAPALTREVDGIVPAPLVIVPSTKALTAPGWRRLEQIAAHGATVYVSYFPGDSAAQRGLWHRDLDGFFGVEKHLRYGLTDPIPGDTVEWTFTEEFGSIGVQGRLTFAVNGNANGTAFLPVRATAARVCATDAAGNPALLVRDVGAGRIVFSTYPLEYLAASTPRVNPNDVVRFYTALAQVAGVRPPLSVDDPRVLADVLEHEDGRRFGVLVSQADEKVSVRAVLPDGQCLATLDEDAPVSREITIEPFGVEVFRLAEATG